MVVPAAQQGTQRLRCVLALEPETCVRNLGAYALSIDRQSILHQPPQTAPQHRNSSVSLNGIVYRSRPNMFI